MSDDPQRFLLVKASGFGNRILSACTGIVIAAMTDRVAVVDWRDGEYLPAGKTPTLSSSGALRRIAPRVRWT